MSPTTLIFPYAPIMQIRLSPTGSNTFRIKLAPTSVVSINPIVWFISNATNATQTISIEQGDSPSSSSATTGKGATSSSIAIAAYTNIVGSQVNNNTFFYT